jgi:hypothetical protein
VKTKPQHFDDGEKWVGSGKLAGHKLAGHKLARHKLAGHKLAGPDGRSRRPCDSIWVMSCDRLWVGEMVRLCTGCVGLYVLTSKVCQIRVPQTSS